MLNASRLRMLTELEDRGSLAAVADALGYTPSAVSQQLAKLEAETGRVLLEPVGRGVILTDAGHLLAGHGREVLERLELAERALADTGELTGRLRVGSFQTAARALVLPAFAELAKRHPALTLELADHEPEASLPLLRAGELDVAIVEEYPHAPRERDPRLERHELGSDEMLVALPARHPLARAGGPVRLADLSEESWATPWAGTAYSAMVERACRAAGFEPQVRHHVTDFATLLDLARAGLSVALVPALGGRSEGRGLALRPLAGSGLRRQIFAATRRSAAGTRAVDAFLAALSAP